MRIIWHTNTFPKSWICNPNPVVSSDEKYRRKMIRKYGEYIQTNPNKNLVAKYERNVEYLTSLNPSNNPYWKLDSNHWWSID